MQEKPGQASAHLLVMVPFILPKKIMESNEHFIYIKYHEILFIYS